MSVPKLALNTEEAAIATGLSVDLIKRAIRSGALRAKRSGVLEKDTTRGKAGDPAGRYLVTVDALQAWLDSLEDA
jgi:hypothetical protein